MLESTNKWKKEIEIFFDNGTWSSITSNCEALISEWNISGLEIYDNFKYNARFNFELFYQSHISNDSMGVLN